jgi:Ima1 N-terminal domain
MLVFNLNKLILFAVFGGFFLYGFIKILISLRLTANSIIKSLNFLTFLPKSCRKRFSIKVNCWFCNTNTRVPYNDWNSFTCPTCCQYNGFDENGDYNKEISAQHYSKLNPNEYCEKFDPRLRYPPSNFCDHCARNQELKIIQLANFKPRSESTYDEEIEDFK